MMAVLSRVPHCRPQLLPVELGTDMQHGQSMSAPPAEYHGGASSTLLALIHHGPQGGSPGAVCASGGGSAAHGTRNEGSVWVMYDSHLALAPRPKTQEP